MLEILMEFELYMGLIEAFMHTCTHARTHARTHVYE